MEQEVALDVQPQEAEAAPLDSVAGVLRLVGSGGGGPILMALDRGPLRTQQLTDRLTHLSSRSAYRHIGNLREQGLIARTEEPGVPSHVVLSLTNPLGRNLCRLLRAFASSTMSRFPRRGDGSEPWDTLALLGDFWELGLIKELSYGPSSVIELTRKAHPVTYHQVNRRASLFAANGLASSFNANGNGKCYELSDHGRRCMGLIAGIGRWRQRYVLDEVSSGLTIEEVATILRVALPLVCLPEYAGMSVGFEISESAEGNGYRNQEALQATIGADGRMACELEPRISADGSAAATINTWFGVLLEGNRGRVKVGGDLTVVDACLTRLYNALWGPQESPATPASNGASAG